MEDTPPSFFVNPQLLVISPHDANLLSLLGVTNASVFLANCGIWVEGVTDRIYVKAYLSAYLESDEFKENENSFNPKEDIHYAFFEYAGSNLSHYIFGDNHESENHIKARFLNNRIFLLADKDNGKEGKHQPLESLTDNNFVYRTTSGREIENMISEHDLKMILPKLHKDISSDSIANLEINYDDYQGNIGIGEYLTDTLSCPETIRPPRKGGERSHTLTTKYKNGLALLVKDVTTWTTMSKDAKELTKDIYQFICRHNYIV